MVAYELRVLPIGVDQVALVDVARLVELTVNEGDPPTLRGLTEAISEARSLRAVIPAGPMTIGFDEVVNGMSNFKFIRNDAAVALYLENPEFEILVFDVPTLEVRRTTLPISYLAIMGKPIDDLMIGDVDSMDGCLIRLIEELIFRTRRYTERGISPNPSAADAGAGMLLQMLAELKIYG